MTRKGDDAAHYEAHKDDADLWGESEGIEEAADLQRRTGLTATITVRFSVEEAEAIRQAARKEHLTYSQVVRMAVQAFTRPQVAVTSGGPSNFFQGYAATRATTEGARFEPTQAVGTGTRTGGLSSPTPD